MRLGEVQSESHLLEEAHHLLHQRQECVLVPVPYNNVVQVGQERHSPCPETLKWPGEDLGEDERSGIQTERKRVKKV